MQIVADMIKAIALYLVVHEAGHYLMALSLGVDPKIVFKDWRVMVSYGYKKQSHYTLISEAGFGLGMIVALALALSNESNVATIYMAALTLHFWAYPWYNRGESNDFNGMCSHLSGDEDEDEDDGED